VAAGLIDRRLANQHADMTEHLTIITGASRGMGLAIAQQLLQAGHHVIGISRHVNEALAAQARDAQSVLEQWTEDLSDGENASRHLEDWLGSRRVEELTSVTLINNAGVITDIGPLSKLNAHDIARALRVGLEAPMLLTAAFLHATRDWKVKRKVLNISSGLGRRAMASQAAYCAAKAGMDHFTRCVALEEALQSNGAKVCSLAPGVIDTDMQDQLRTGDFSLFPDRSSFAALKDGGQLTSPVDAANRVLAYLARHDFGSMPVADVRDPSAATSEP
jgi:benzil reductase ((S)-benzoin forming)